ncbi:MAG: MarR family winged helix-turn-helix transcriptional regulator [Caulobacteraceae bacterium]
MIDKESEIRPDGKSLGLPDYLIWLGNQLTATAVGAYATLGVGFLEARILFAVGRIPNLPAASLVQRLGVDRAAISRALQQLRSAGMILADDHRRLSLSDAGWVQYAEVVRISDARLARFTAGLTEPELEQLLGLLQRLHQNVPELSVLNGHLVATGGRARHTDRTALQRAGPLRAVPRAIDET